MRDDTARAMLLFDLSLERIKKLHAYELRIGRKLMPCEIFQLGRLVKYGSVSYDTYEPWERAVMAIRNNVFETYLADCKTAGESPNDIMAQHIVDMKVRMQVPITRGQVRGTAAALRKDVDSPEEVGGGVIP